MSRKRISNLGSADRVAWLWERLGYVTRESFATKAFGGGAAASRRLDRWRRLGSVPRREKIEEMLKAIGCPEDQVESGLRWLLNGGESAPAWVRSLASSAEDLRIASSACPALGGVFTGPSDVVFDDHGYVSSDLSGEVKPSERRHGRARLIVARPAGSPPTIAGAYAKAEPIAVFGPDASTATLLADSAREAQLDLARAALKTREPEAKDSILRVLVAILERPKPRPKANLPGLDSNQEFNDQNAARSGTAKVVRHLRRFPEVFAKRVATAA